MDHDDFFGKPELVHECLRLLRRFFEKLDRIHFSRASLDCQARKQRVAARADVDDDFVARGFFKRAPVGVVARFVVRHRGVKHVVVKRIAATRRGGRPKLDRRSRFAHDVGCEPPVARRVLARDHRAVEHTRLLPERRFDFAGLDAEAANFHLLIDAAEKLDLAARQKARAVAGFVKSRARLF